MPRPLSLAAGAALCAALVLPAASAQQARPVLPGETVRDVLAGDGPHVYEVTLDAGQLVAGEVD